MLPSPPVLPKLLVSLLVVLLIKNQVMKMTLNGSRGGNSLDGGTSAYPSDLVVDDLVTTSSIVGNVDDVADATTSDISIVLDVDATNQHDKLDDDGSPNDGGTTDGGDSVDGAPKGEVSDGSFAGSVSGYDISTKEGSLEGKYDDKVDVNKGLLKMKGNDGATAGAAFHVSLQTPVPVSCHSPQ